MQWGFFASFAMMFAMVWPLSTLAATALVATSMTRALATDAPEVAGPATSECVVVLHGLARSSRSMAKLAGRLAEGGFAVRNLDYPSTKEPFEALAGLVAAEVESGTDACEKVHFVGYSLGALLVRAILERSPPKNLGRVVMIAPPNHGSEIVDAIGGTRFFRAIYGPVGPELGTSPAGIPARLGAPAFEAGIIAGNRAINLFGWALLPGENDGTVSVASARLEGMRDFIVVPRSHTFIMDAPEVAAQAKAFLRSGSFDHGGAR